MFCNNCGAKLDDGSKFCNVCGNKIGEVTAPPQPKQPSKFVLLINKADLKTRNVFAIIACAIYFIGTFIPIGYSEKGTANLIEVTEPTSISGNIFIYYAPCFLALIFAAYGKHIGIIVCGAFTTLLTLMTIIGLQSWTFGIGRIVLFIGAAGILAAGIYAKIKLKRS